ncbi:MAG: hypothetical protein ACKOBV_09800, partial [Candidatus Kapaibacterium sp.]
MHGEVLFHTRIIESLVGQTQGGTLVLITGTNFGPTTTKMGTYSLSAANSVPVVTYGPTSQKYTATS